MASIQNGKNETPVVSAPYLTQTQFDILRSWAQQTPQVQEAYLFGSCAKGQTDSASDIDIAIRASGVKIGRH